MCDQPWPHNATFRDLRRPPALPIFSAPGDLSSSAASFARYLRAANIAPATLKTYAEAVRTLSGFLAERGMPTDVAVITREHVEAFITMRLPGDWTIAERELFAAYVSVANRCDFCIACHVEYACQAGDRAAVESTLRDGATGDPRLDAALAFLAAFAAGPSAIETSHITRLRATGVRDEAIRDLAQIGFSFCLINRVADALEFRVPAAELFARTWPTMRDRGYRF